jgi:hypothetical protein
MHILDKVFHVLSTGLGYAALGIMCAFTGGVLTLVYFAGSGTLERYARSYHCERCCDCGDVHDPNGVGFGDAYEDEDEEDRRADSGGGT